MEMGVGTGRGYSVNLPLFPYTGDDDYIEGFSQVVPPLIRAFNPDVLVAQLGIDSYHRDPLTHLQMTTEGYIEVVRQLIELGLPLLALGGGGYDVNAVARAWTLVYGMLLDVEWPNILPPGFARKHGVGHLRDETSPEGPEELKVDIRRHLEATVGEIRQQIFPIHGLK